MSNLKINMTFECLTWRQPIVSCIIKECIKTNEVDIWGIEAIEKDVNPNRDRYC